MKNIPEISMELQDTEWPFVCTDHDRQIVRTTVFDDQGFFICMIMVMKR